MKKIAIIVAAGSGTRMQASQPKQFLTLEEQPLLWHTLHAFCTAFDDMEIILVLAQDYLEAGQKIATDFADSHPIQIVTGGESRYHSVKNGLGQIEAEAESAIVFVHDGVRCLVSPTLIRECYDNTIENSNAVPAIACIDSLRWVDETGNRRLDRAHVQIVQTPQTFQLETLKQAYELPYDPAFTDDASVVEALGKQIHLITGDSTNIKITRPIDLILAGQIMAGRK